MVPVRTPTKRRIAKPLGVSVLCAFDGIFIGLLPLVLLIILDRDPKLEIPLWNYVLSAIISISVVAAALAAFIGENAGRLTLLWSVTIHSVLIILNNVDLIMGGGTQPASIAPIGNITRGVFWTGINWWYLNRSGVVEFYQQKRTE